MNSLARFETDLARRHLAALCRHFGRTAEVRCSPTNGWVRFPFGACDMTATDDALELRASAEKAQGLDAVIRVMTNHLDRYAFRENPRLNWRTDEGPPPPSHPDAPERNPAHGS